jgi:hypothetical protein
MRKHLEPLVVSVVLLVVAGTVMAVAQTGTDPINGCVNNRTGALRISEQCTAKETPLSWNAQGPAGPSYGGYTEFEAPSDNQSDTIPVAGPNPTSNTLLKVDDLPDGTYFGVASWEFVTNSPNDVGVNCRVGNEMAHKLLVPGGSGVTRRDASFTLSGINTPNAHSMELSCGIVGWAGQFNDPPTPMPFVGMQRGSLQAIFVSSLTVTP